MTVEYDGTRYVGWQRQINGVSVQEKIEEALEKHLGERVTVRAAGRTDSGVHAAGQVISFHTSSSLPARAIWKGVLERLPRDVTVLESEEMPADFDARRSAKLRWYRYFVCNRPVAPAIGRSYVTHVPYPMDLAVVREAAAMLGGEQNFSAFRSRKCTAHRTNLTMWQPRVSELGDGIIRFDYRCQSFLQNMVRIMTGILVECGRGRMRLEQVREMLETGQRAVEARTMLPNGLFLYRVLYDSAEIEALRKQDDEEHG